MKISEHIERLVQLLHGEEPKITTEEDEMAVMKMTPELLKELEHGSKEAATTEDKKPTEEEDDEDMRIEEI